MREDEHEGAMSWGRFAAMIATSTVLMFALAYHLVYAADHVVFSVTRLIGALTMACAMTAVMLGFMWKSYRPAPAKIAVLAAAIVGGLALLAVNRSQLLVDDRAYMQAMIPHHSIAINNSRRADIRDPRVRYLADRITRDQVKEIEEMRALIADIDRDGRQGERPLPAGPAVLTPEAAQETRDLLSGALMKKEPLPPSP